MIGKIKDKNKMQDYWNAQVFFYNNDNIKQEPQMPSRYTPKFKKWHKVVLAIVIGFVVITATNNYARATESIEFEGGHIITSLADKSQTWQDENGNEMPIDIDGLINLGRPAQHINDLIEDLLD